MNISGSRSVGDMDSDESAGTLSAVGGLQVTPVSTISASPAPSPSAEDAPETIEAYRVVPHDQSTVAFSSSANRSGGRWTHQGIPAVYASISPAGAVLEFLVHMDGSGPADLVMVSAVIPARLAVSARSLPKQWRAYPYVDEVREYGDAWIESRESLALLLPSVLCESSKNVLINPEHEEAGRIKVTGTAPFTLDKRLLSV